MLPKDETAALKRRLENEELKNCTFRPKTTWKKVFGVGAFEDGGSFGVDGGIDSTFIDDSGDGFVFDDNDGQGNLIQDGASKSKSQEAWVGEREGEGDEGSSTIGEVTNILGEVNLVEGKVEDKREQGEVEMEGWGDDQEEEEKEETFGGGKEAMVKKEEGEELEEEEELDLVEGGDVDVFLEDHDEGIDFRDDGIEWGDDFSTVNQVQGRFDSGPNVTDQTGDMTHDNPFV